MPHAPGSLPHRFLARQGALLGALLGALPGVIPFGAQAATPVAPAVAALVSDPSLDYTVQPRDTLIGLGQTLLTSRASWPEVARLNRLPNPNHIHPGQTLKVPMRLLRAAPESGRIVSIEGTVTLAGQPARAGDAWAPGSTLNTASASSAVAALGDGSRIQLKPLSQTTLEEHRRFALKAGQEGSGEGLMASTLRLISGSIDVLAAKVRRAKPLEVITPTAVIGTRGTTYRVHAEAERSGTEVLEGRVRAEARNGPGADVAAGLGAMLAAGQAPLVAALAAPPDLSTLPERFERPVLRFQLPGDALAWRVQIASDAAFDHLVRDERVAPGAEVRVTGLADGPWQLRVRRIDPNGIEGLDAQRAINLKARPEPPALMAPRPKSKQMVGQVALAWAENTEASSYRLQIARDAGFSQIVQQLDEVSGGKTQLTLTDPGHYVWRLGSRRPDGDLGPWGDAQSFELRALPAAPSGGLTEDGQGLHLNWTARPGDVQQVELARDPGFSQVLARAELAQADWQLPAPEYPGTVYFRYRSVEPDGFTSPWSSALKIDIPYGWGWLLLGLPLLFAL